MGDVVEVGFSREPVHYDLRTAPGAWVELRRLPYDEILKRREMGTRLSMEQSGGNRRNRRSKEERQESQKIGIELAQVVTREYEFANCIVDHNLVVDGTPVDFRIPKTAFKLVSPQVLQEIELYLSELNMETDEEELDDFTPAATPSSGNDQTLKSTLGTASLDSVPST